MLTRNFEGGEATIRLDPPAGYLRSVVETFGFPSKRRSLSQSDFVLEEEGAVLRRLADGPHPAEAWGKVEVVYEALNGEADAEVEEPEDEPHPEPQPQPRPQPEAGKKRVPVTYIGPKDVRIITGRSGSLYRFYRKVTVMVEPDDVRFIATDESLWKVG